MFNQKFGVEIEMTGLTRRTAAKIAAEYFGTDRVSVRDSKWGCYDRQGRLWKFVPDGSVDENLSENGCPIDYNSNSLREDVEMVTPPLTVEDIPDLIEILKRLREKGAYTNFTCGLHIHIDAEPHDAASLRNLVRIMAAKEPLLYEALGVSAARKIRWCKPVEQELLDALRRPVYDIEDLKHTWYSLYSEPGCQHYHPSRYHGVNLHAVWDKGTIEFRYFNSTLDAATVVAYIHLCLAVSHQALTQKASSARITTTGNKNFTFRTWLLRLGMIGAEFAETRRILLKNLPGDTAWRYDRSHYACLNRTAAVAI